MPLEVAVACALAAVAVCSAAPRRTVVTPPRVVSRRLSSSATITRTARPVARAARSDQARRAAWARREDQGVTVHE
jgi:hypothetical protein